MEDLDDVFEELEDPRTGNAKRHLLHEVGAPVFPHELEDFLVALEVLCADFHGRAWASLRVAVSQCAANGRA